MFSLWHSIFVRATPSQLLNLGQIYGLVSGFFVLNLGFVSIVSFFLALTEFIVYFQARLSGPAVNIFMVSSFLIFDFKLVPTFVSHKLSVFPITWNLEDSSVIGRDENFFTIISVKIEYQVWLKIHPFNKVIVRMWLFFRVLTACWQFGVQLKYCFF